MWGLVIVMHWIPTVQGMGEPVDASVVNRRVGGGQWSSEHDNVQVSIYVYIVHEYVYIYIHVQSVFEFKWNETQNSAKETHLSMFDSNPEMTLQSGCLLRYVIHESKAYKIDHS